MGGCGASLSGSHAGLHGSPGDRSDPRLPISVVSARLLQEQQPPPLLPSGSPAGERHPSSPCPHTSRLSRHPSATSPLAVCALFSALRLGRELEEGSSSSSTFPAPERRRGAFRGRLGGGPGVSAGTGLHGWGFLFPPGSPGRCSSRGRVRLSRAGWLMFSFFSSQGVPGSPGERGTPGKPVRPFTALHEHWRAVGLGSSEVRGDFDGSGDFEEGTFSKAVMPRDTAQWGPGAPTAPIFRAQREGRW